MKNDTLASVPSHPNRSKTNVHAGTNPTPAQVRRARAAAGLTLEQAGELVYTSWRTWQNWEADVDSGEHRRMHASTWELFQVKLAAKQLLEERSLTPAHIRALGLYLPSAE